MVPCASGVDGMRPVLRRALQNLLQRDGAFAKSFMKDRRTFERVVKMATGAHCSSRLERSASLHCIVLTFRLARVDDFAAEMALPVMIAGTLSGVVQYEGEEPQRKTGQERSIPTAGDNEDPFGQQKKKESACWPSTPLSSAQELAAHAVVNPLVKSCSQLMFLVTSILILL